MKKGIAMNLFRVTTLFILIIMLSSPYAQPNDVKQLTDSLGTLKGKLKDLSVELAGGKKKTGDGKGPQPGDRGGLFAAINKGQFNLKKVDRPKSPKATKPLSDPEIDKLRECLTSLQRAIDTAPAEEPAELKDAFDDTSLVLIEDMVFLADALKVLKGFGKSAVNEFQKMFPAKQYRVFAKAIEQRIKEEREKDAAVAKKQKDIKQLKADLKKIAANPKDPNIDLKIETLDSKIAGTLFTDKDWSKADIENIHGFLLTKKASKPSDEQAKYELLHLAVVAKLNVILADEKRAKELEEKRKKEAEAAAQARLVALNEIKKNIQKIMTLDRAEAKQLVVNFSLNGFDLKSLTSDDKAFILGNIKFTDFSLKVIDLSGRSNDLDNLIKRLSKI